MGRYTGGMNSRDNLDQPRGYTIRVAGRLSAPRLEFFQELAPRVEIQPDGGELITLCGRFADQAALMGTLQNLYNLGCVLVSVDMAETL